MEIIEETTGRGYRAQPRQDNKLYIGIVIALAGVLWTLYNLDIMSYSLFRTIFSAPVLVAVCGGYLLSMKHWCAGSITLAAGVLFFIIKILKVQISTEIGFSLLLIIAGIAFIISGIRKR